MELGKCAGKNHASRQLVEHKASVHQNSHCDDPNQVRRNWQAFKILRLTRAILWNVVCADIETGQTGQTTQNPVRQNKRVHSRSKANCKGNYGRRHAEGNEIGQGVEFLAHERSLVSQTGDTAIKKVEKKAQANEKVGSLHIVQLTSERKAQARDDGVEPGKPVQKGDEVGHVQVSNQGKVAIVVQKVLVVLWIRAGQRFLVGRQRKQRRRSSQWRVWSIGNFDIAFGV